MFRATRCLTVWLVTSTLALPATVVLLASAVPLRTEAFAPLLADLCTAALAVCLGWLWLVTGALTATALRGRPRLPRACPRVVGAVLLVACGLSAVPVASAEPAGRPPTPDPSSGGSVLAGLPVPDRQSGGPASVGPGRPRTRVVRPGDCLWTIAETTLPQRADDAAVVRRWQRIWRTNRDVLGPDPDLIHPGVRLRLPSRGENR